MAAAGASFSASEAGSRLGSCVVGGLAAAAIAAAVSGAMVSGRASRRAVHEASMPSARALTTTTSALTTSSALAATSSALAATSSAPAATSSAPAATSSAPAATSSALAATSSARTIAGVVRDLSGAAVTGAEVGSSDWALGRAKTDAQGRFQLSGVKGDAVALYALAAGFAPARVEHVLAGSRDVVLVLSPPARITGALRLPADAGRVLVSLCRSNAAAAREPQGELCVARRLYSPPAERYELERLAAGNYTIVAEVTGRGPATTPEPSPALPTLRLPVVIPAGTSVDGPLLAWP